MRLHQLGQRLAPKAGHHAGMVGCAAVLAELELAGPALHRDADADDGVQHLLHVVGRRVVHRPGRGARGLVGVGQALHDGVQRVAAVPAARQYLRQWHTATGQLGAPLITVHNSIDSLVPYSQEEALARAVEAAGRQDRLLQFTVPAVRAPLPVYGIEGYTHCGFNKPETIAAWKFLRQWVETGARPTTTTLGDGVR